MSDTGAAILYVDDDEGLRLLTRRALERRGFRVTLAGSGEEGLVLAAAEPFDLVAIDHHMPGKDGMQTLAELRQLPSPPPVIYVTGSDETRLAVGALKAGAIDYVLKTADENYFDLLGQAVNQALEKVRLQHEHAQAVEKLRETNELLKSLLQEVNHRVANSLQIVSTFVRMQARALDDETAKGALEDTERRVAAIAQVHKKLYTSASVKAVDMDDYLASLVAELAETLSTPGAARDIQLAVDPIAFSPDNAVALGVIINELVTNACKYAYPPDMAGRVSIALKAQEGGAFSLSIDDDGCGMPPEAAAKGTGLGSKLIAAMVQKLKASIAYEDRAPGLRVVVSGAVKTR